MLTQKQNQTALRISGTQRWQKSMS